MNEIESSVLCADANLNMESISITEYHSDGAQVNLQYTPRRNGSDLHIQVCDVDRITQVLAAVCHFSVS